MIPRICPICGKQIGGATVCPRCNTNVPPRAKSLPISIQQEHLKLYEYMLPATEDPEKLSVVERRIEQYMEKYKTILSHNAHKVLHWTLFDTFRVAQDRWEAKKEADRRAVNKVLASVNAAMNQQSTYEGLGFSVITDTAGAAAYAALDAVQGHIHDVNQSLAAYKKALSDISSVSLSSNHSYIVRPVFEGIDRVVAYLAVMLESKIFVDEHRDFYESFLNDTKIGGKYVSGELRQAAKDNEFVGWFYGSSNMQPYQLMEAAGYVHLFFHKKGVAEYFCTTGKFETEMLQAAFFKQNPKIAAEEKKYIAEANQIHCAQAEISLNEGKYFRAAARYAQTMEDRNALRRSLRIWNQHLLQIPHMERGNLLGADGDPKALYCTRDSILIPFDAKLFDEGVKYKQVYGCGSSQYVGLSMDGKVYSNAENIYGDQKVSKSELGTGYLPGNGGGWTQIIAIACSGEHLVGLRTDGTVCAVGNNTQGQCEVGNWSEVTFVVAAANSTAAIRKDGSVLLAGAIAQCAPDAAKWTKMKRLYLRGEGIVGLQEDGQVQAAGKTSFDCQVVSRWRNVVRIDWLDEGIFGIQDAGDVVCDNKDPVTEMLCRKLSGVVQIIHFETPRSYKFEKRPCLIALRADGTVFSFGTHVDFSDWSDIVYVDYHEYNGPNLLAINANGQFLFKGTEFFESGKEDLAFPHIDTYVEWKKQTLQEVLEHKKRLMSKAKGLFAGKRRKEIQTSIDFLQNELAQM